MACGISKRMTSEHPSNSLRWSIDLNLLPSRKRRKIEQTPLENEDGNPTYLTGLNKTGIPITSIDEVSIKRIEMPVIDQNIYFKQLIENPISLIRDEERLLVQFMQSIETEPFEKRYTRLMLLLESADTKKDELEYKNTWVYPDFSAYFNLYLNPSCLAQTHYDRLVFLIKTQSDAIKEEQKLIQEMKLHDVFHDFDFETVWKLAIDYKDHTRGRYAYENEPGYLKGYFAGLRFVFKQVREGSFIPNWDTLCQIHDIMTDKVEGYFNIPIQALGKNNKSRICCIITPTVAFQRQIEKTFKTSRSTQNSALIIKSGKYYQIEMRRAQRKMQILFRKITRCDTIAKEIERANSLYKEFEEKWQGAKTTRTKELAIIFYVTRLDRMHLFVDGNIRSIIVLWTGIRLMHHFDLMIMDNPNYLDAHSDHELLQIVAKGIINFKSLLKLDAFEYRRRNPVVTFNYDKNLYDLWHLKDWDFGDSKTYDSDDSDDSEDEWHAESFWNSEDS